MNDFHRVDVLLVEDNPYDAELAMRAMHRSHFANRMHWVKDGAEALDFLLGTGQTGARSASEQPKLVLLDIKMPKVDGLEVLRALKADERTRSIPVVMMTSSSQESDVEESYRLGANSFVVKPVEFANFSDAVAKVGMYWLLVNRSP
jgi:two-component system, response regulator